MDYQKAKETRGKSLSSLITDKIVGGEGVMSSIRQSMSEKSKARAVGLREKFDPLNIIKTLTGGSRLAPAILGRLTGRSPEAIQYFSKDPKKRQVSSGISSEELRGAAETMGSIYALMIKMEEEKRLVEDDLLRKQKADEELENDRNKELIKAITGRRKTPKERRKEEVKQKTEQRKEKAETKKEEKKQEQVDKKTEQKKDKVERKKETADKKEAEVKKETAKKVEQAKKEEIKKPEVVPPKEVKPPPTAKPTAPPAAKPPTAAKIPPVVVSGSKGLVLGALVAAGYSKAAQANMMANVEKESNFMPRSEEVPKPEKVFAMFGGPEVKKAKDGRPLNKSGNVVRFPTMEDAKAIVAKGPEAYFNAVYDGRMGNTTPGDGYKYRGRGFIQITGKDMYNRVGKMIGEDLVGNPDLANKPEIAAKIVPAFFQLKMKERKLESKDFENIDIVNETVGGADIKSREDRKKLAVAYASELNTGGQINAASTENRELKKDMADAPPATTIVNNNTTTQTKKQTPMPAAGGDDRSAYAKKVN